MHRGRNLLLLWLAGNSLRMTVLAVPPVLPSIHHQLHLSEALVGALTSLPVVLLALAAIPGSLLISRVGARRALVTGLLLVAVAGAARGIGPSAPLLFVMTFVMGVGIAVSQPSLPSLVKQWFPDLTGPATAIYSNGFLTGEIFAVALTAPIVLPLVGHSWEIALGLWSAPVLLTAAAIALFTPHTEREPGAPALRWWPDWRSSRTWSVGLILGCASISYYGENAFIPDYLKATHSAGLISPALTSLNVCQLPGSFLVAVLAGKVVGRRWPFVVTGTITVIGAVSLAGGSLWVVVGSGLVGFASGTVFILALALAPLLAGLEDVHRLSAAMFTISYACSFIGSLAGGAIWDSTGVPLSAFGPVVVSGVIMVVLALSLQVSHQSPTGAAAAP